MASLAIILVNYNGTEDTLECLRSLRNSRFTDFNVIVVDNGSHDNPEARVHAEFPDVELIANPENRGFAEGNNIGIREATRTNPDFFLLLNNDTVVHPSTLENLVSALKDNPDVGIVGPKIHYFDRPEILWFAGGSVNLGSGVSRHRGIKEHDEGQFDVPEVCDFVTGCCLMFRRELFEKIGGLDSEYFAYYEDADFCLRARRAGYASLYVPTASLLHKVSSSAGWDSNVYLYFQLRNKILFLRKNASAFEILLCAPLILYYYVRQFVRLTVKLHNFPGARSAWWGLVDGLKGRVGIDGAGRLNRLPPTKRRPVSLQHSTCPNGQERTPGV